MVFNVCFLKFKDMHVSKISWHRADGVPLPKNVQTYFGLMNIFNVGKADFVEYSCHVLTADNRLIKKNFVLKQAFTKSSQLHTTHTWSSTKMSKTLDLNLMPKVRIIPIEKDLREGGKVALECESG